MGVLEEGFEEAMSVMLFPQSMKLSLRSTNLLERENGELRAPLRSYPDFPQYCIVSSFNGVCSTGQAQCAEFSKGFIEKEKMCFCLARNKTAGL